MKRNKPRLQLALYARPKHPGTFHFALFVSPKPTTPEAARRATKHHVKNTLQREASGELTQPWRYKRIDIPDVRLELRLLVRVTLAKITLVEILESLAETTPIYQVDDIDQETARGFDCETWVKDALQRFKEEGILTGLRDWDSIQKESVAFVKKELESGSWNAQMTKKAEVLSLNLLEEP